MKFYYLEQNKYFRTKNTIPINLKELNAIKQIFKKSNIQEFGGIGTEIKCDSPLHCFQLTSTRISREERRNNYWDGDGEPDKSLSDYIANITIFKGVGACGVCFELVISTFSNLDDTTVFIRITGVNQLEFNSILDEIIQKISLIKEPFILPKWEGIETSDKSFKVKFEIKSLYEDESYNLEAIVIKSIEADDLDSLLESLESGEVISEIDDSEVVNSNAKNPPIEINTEYVEIRNSDDTVVYWE